MACVLCRGFIFTRAVDTTLVTDSSHYVAQHRLYMWASAAADDDDVKDDDNSVDDYNVERSESRVRPTSRRAEYHQVTSCTLLTTVE